MKSNARHFFVVGAQRAGTTYLWKVLDDHPDIFMAKPVRPEPKYFLKAATIDIDDYRKQFFADAARETLCGEKSTSYLESGVAMRQIARLLPSALIVVMLRNPVERAISNYFFSKKHGFETFSISDALEAESTRLKAPHNSDTSVSPYAYRTRGEYIRYLRQWSNYFPADQILPIIMECFVGSSKAVQALYKNLDVNSEITPSSLNDKINSYRKLTDDQAVPESLRNSLAGHFEPFNRVLEAEFGLDIASWN